MTGSSGPSGSGLQFRRHRGRPGTRHLGAALTQGGVVYTSLLFFMFIRPQPYTCLGIEWLTQGGVVYYFSCL